MHRRDAHFRRRARTPSTVNTRTLSPILALAFITSLPASAQETKPLRERASDAVETTRDTAKKASEAVAKTTRETWVKTKAYLIDDPDTYRRGAELKLNELGAEIAELRKYSVGIKDRTYFLTRVEALEQHHKYAENQLVALLPEDIRKGREGLRKRVDLILARLDDHVDIAQKEARDFTSLP